MSQAPTTAQSNAENTGLLNRILDKLDRVSEDLAKFTERVEQLAERLAEHATYGDRIRVLEVRADEQEKRAKAYQWGVGFVITAVLALASILADILVRGR